jgi:hypothetical protein
MLPCTASKAGLRHSSSVEASQSSSTTGCPLLQTRVGHGLWRLDPQGVLAREIGGALELPRREVGVQLNALEAQRGDVAKHIRELTMAGAVPGSRKTDSIKATARSVCGRWA